MTRPPITITPQCAPGQTPCPFCGTLPARTTHPRMQCPNAECPIHRVLFTDKEWITRPIRPQSAPKATEATGSFKSLTSEQCEAITYGKPPKSDPSGAAVSETPQWALDLADRYNMEAIRERDELKNRLRAVTAERDEAANAAYGGQELVDSLRADRDQLAAEVARLKGENELYAGWSRWRAGLWLVTHPESGHSAAFVGEVDALSSTQQRVRELEADRERLDKLEALNPLIGIPVFFGKWEEPGTNWILGGHGHPIRPAIDAARTPSPTPSPDGR